MPRRQNCYCRLNRGLSCWHKYNVCHLADDIFKCIFMDDFLLIKISLKFVPSGPSDNSATFLYLIRWCRAGGDPWYESTMAYITEILMRRTASIDLPMEGLQNNTYSPEMSIWQDSEFEYCVPHCGTPANSELISMYVDSNLTVLRSQHTLRGYRIDSLSVKFIFSPWLPSFYVTRWCLWKWRTRSRAIQAHM